MKVNLLTTTLRSLRTASSSKEHFGRDKNNKVIRQSFLIILHILYIQLFPH
jgi:hypothetical protein